ncbi:MAG: TetR/AcrR family transcriptional regulator [Rhodospirillum sp.]|nr:TetR/AcrR family transcriptional regulator [Rhodospirillum sp.]MCF8488819.1 TetR/AcrR family transcriptional regulator [Rhodospirillum sp.]MCF8500901.1 TetR/AcrR family transcriptional regulator [Rhodospirillum sp.]
MTRQPKWRRRSEARPEEIVEAALAIFAERGFAAARVEDIARRAGVTKGTLYLYFDDKQALFKAAVQTHILGTVTQAEETLSHDTAPAPEVLRAVVGGIGETLLRGPAGVIPKLLVSEAGNFPDLVQFYMNAVIKRGFGLIGRTVERGVAEGDFAPIAPNLAARLLMAPVAMMAIWRHSLAPWDPDPVDPEDWLKAHLTVTLAGLAVEKGGRTA